MCPMSLCENQQDNKYLAILTRGHRDSILINKIRNEKGDIRKETEEILKNNLPQKPILSKTGICSFWLCLILFVLELSGVLLSC